MCKWLGFVTFCNKVVSWHSCIVLFWAGSYNKHSTHSASPRGTVRGLGKQNSTIKCLITSKHWWRFVKSFENLRCELKVHETKKRWNLRYWTSSELRVVQFCMKTSKHVTVAYLIFHLRVVCSTCYWLRLMLQAGEYLSKMPVPRTNSLVNIVVR